MGKEFEEFQKGNPHRLTKQQHIFPAASIRRFQGNDGCVQVFRGSVGSCFSARPSNSVFVAQRLWDEKAENGVGKRIEDKYQALADGVLTGSLKSIGPLEKPIVEEFYSLWRTRHGFRVRGLPDLQINHVTGVALTKDEEEILETKHTMYVRQNGIMPGRLIAGVHILGYYDRFRETVKSLQWGIVRAVEGEFIVPDCFHDVLIIPLAPKMLIMGGMENSLLKYDDVAEINRCAIESSSEYYFARSLGSCPVAARSKPMLQKGFVPLTNPAP